MHTCGTEGATHLAADLRGDAECGPKLSGLLFAFVGDSRAHSCITSAQTVLLWLKRNGAVGRRRTGVVNHNHGLNLQAVLQPDEQLAGAI